MTDEIFIPNFSKEDLAAAMGQLGIEPIDETTTPIAEVQPQPIKRRRGRPRKHPLPEGQVVATPLSEASTPEKILEPAKLTKRDEREVSDRLSKLLIGVTGLVAIPTRPYFEMTPEEAKDISDPLSSYLVRNAETIPIAREILENYDIALIALGLVAYLVRVYGERRNELAAIQATRVANPERPTLARISQIQAANNEQQSVQGEDAQASVEDPTRGNPNFGYGGVIPGV